MPLPDSPGSRSSSGENDDQAVAFIGRGLEEKPLWSGLGESLRDRFFPPRVPPLELTSPPVAVPDRMAAKTNPWAIGTSTVVNGSIAALLIWLGMHAVVAPGPKLGPTARFTFSDFPIFAQQKAHTTGSQGGGTNDLVDPIKGRLPRIEQTPLTPPQAAVLDHPKLAVDPAIAAPLDIKLPDNPALPNVGVHTSVNVTLLSGGPGAHGGIGFGSDDGLGPGHGNNGYGPGGDGVYTVGGEVTEPVPIVTPEAEFSDEARRARFQGVCMIALIVDAHGNPVNPRVVRRLGMGLDDRALDAVRRYRFKPAMKQGRPVPVQITVAVDFRLY